MTNPQRWTRPVATGLLAAAVALAGCEERSPQTASPASAVTTPPPADPPPTRSTPSTRAPGLFTEITTEIGLDFRHQSGHVDGTHFMAEILGGGAAVFDADGDGNLDLYFVNAGDRLPTDATANTAPNRLYLQQPGGVFRDATAGSGLDDMGYGMGCTIGDMDDDGDLDVYVTNWGADTLFRNDGNGVFTDVTEAAGIDNRSWACSASFLDYDRDGDLDLYVANYIDLDPARICTDDAGRPDYCGPKAFPGVTDRLYRNLGEGRFEDVTAAAGIAAAAYAGLGVVCADFNRDGWVDIYVANDADPNDLWINQGDGTFLDDAIILGAAFNRHGQPEAGMGIGVGDPDRDGDLDLYVTHLMEETNTYYRNLGSLGFDDATGAVNLGEASVGLTGFGVAFFDFDHDAALDVAVVNGAVGRRPQAMTSAAGFLSDYVEPNLLLRNDGTGRFVDVTPQTGGYGETLELSRGVIPADLDADGDLDLIVTNIEGPARVYRNDAPAAGSNWLRVRVRLAGSNRDALGATITAVRPDGTRLIRPVIASFGYLTAVEPEAHFGLGDAAEVSRLIVDWPDGRREAFPGVAAGQRVEVRQGAGQPASPDVEADQS
ncbi:MAG: CRTAC1 family protein [Phycisphaerae bacterium]|nr:CRTAC1 family protein [Phycisphaerae bacterium]